MDEADQFISQRDSLASSFISQTSSQPSYLLSSRHRFTEEASLQNDLQEFREEIQFKFIRSVANKIYTFPTCGEAFDMFNDEEEFKQLRNTRQYELVKQNEEKGEDKFKKQHSKIKHNQIKSETAKLLIETLKSETDRLDNLKNFVRENFITKRKSKSKLNSYIKDSLQPSYGVIQQQRYGQNNKRKRMQTQPNQKPTGLIIRRN